MVLTGAARTIIVNYTMKVMHHRTISGGYTATSKVNSRAGIMIGRNVTGNPFLGQPVGNGCDYYPSLHLHPYPIGDGAQPVPYFRWVGDSTVHAQWVIPLRTVVLPLERGHLYKEILNPDDPPVFSWSGGAYSFTNTLIVEGPNAIPHELTDQRYNVDTKFQQWLTSVIYEVTAVLGDTATASCVMEISGPGTSGVQGLSLTTPDGRVTGSVSGASITAGNIVNQGYTARVSGYSRARCKVTQYATITRMGEPETEAMPLTYRFGYGSEWKPWDGPEPPFIPTVGQGNQSYTYGGDVVGIEGTSGSMSGYTPSPEGILWPREFAPAAIGLPDNELQRPFVYINTPNLGLPTARGGPKTGGITISQTPECDYEGASKAFVLAAAGSSQPQDRRWRIENGGSISVASGKLRFTGNAVRSQVQRGYTAQIDRTGVLTGYRHIKVRFRSLGVANQPLRFAANYGVDTNRAEGDNPPDVQWWKLKTGDAGEWVETTVDMLADLTPDSPNSGNKYNRTSTYGIVTGWTFFGLVQGVTYEVEYIRGVRLYETRWNAWRLGNDIAKLWTMTDGLSGYFIKPARPGEETLPISIQTIVNEINAEPLLGMTASVPATPPIPPQFTPDFRPLGTALHDSRFLAGNGITRENEDVTFWLDRVENGTFTIPAQTYGPLSIFDGCGDVQLGRANSTDMKVRHDLQSGMRIVGTVVPASGEVISKLVGGDGSVFSRDTPTKSGFYKLHLFADTNNQRQYNISPTAKFKYGLFYAKAFGTFAIQNPQIVRAPDFGAGLGELMRWYVEPVGQWISADASRLGRHVRASRGVDKDGNTAIVTDYSAFFGAFSWAQKGDSLDGTRPCVRYDDQGRVWVIYEVANDGGIKLAHVENEGGEWVMSATVNTSGKFPTFCHGQTGLMYSFWRTEAGNIESKILDSQGTVVYPASGVITVTAGGVSEDALTAWPDHNTQRLYLQYRIASGEIVIKTSTDGKTWA